MKKNTIALSVLSIMLLAGCNETEYRDNPIPVDANTRGFWTLSSTEDCELSDYCYVDYSEYNSKLYPIDSGERMLTALEAKNAEVSVSGRLENAIKLVPFIPIQEDLQDLTVVLLLEHGIILTIQKILNYVHVQSCWHR